MPDQLADVRLEEPCPSNLPPIFPAEGMPKRHKRILFVTSEFTDFVKAGGLGDVSAALPRALLAEHDIRVLLPGYPQVLQSAVACKVVGHLPGMAALPACDIGELRLADGLVVYALICPELYDRHGTPYGDDQGQEWPDNHIRFARLSLAAADIAAGRSELSWCPDLLHVNDWPAALAPAYMAWREQATPSVLTIHNLGYQGSCPLGCCAELGLPDTAGLPESMEFYGKLSFLKAGISHASHITTVSETYAREITGEKFGCGMHGVLTQRRRRGQLSGITHGIDGSWTPNLDPHLVERFDATHLAGKRRNAEHVERQFGLLPGRGPLFAVVSRLVHQKGIDLTLAIADEMIAAGGRLVVIGRGEPELEQAMKRLAENYPGRVGVHIGFDETEARRIFAASDFLLMPSRYEPCGLSQMYAQRFGSLPIARHTGGLADTIVDGVTGLLFRDETPESYFDAISRALNIYRYPDLLDAMRRKAMKSPLRWEDAARPYTSLYQRLLQQAPARAFR
ncbi:glycogen synthase GlgA [Pseudomonas sp. ZM23]|uniref:Glycogen synthase n=1 Tax=Pseudomonas triclosanedens TaxID=2961893 RepID=A0ABY7A754_9PSED|nr:glycogen synthase GlgA [Pseudomonas triclosanedens]MCP8466266.1 glycogen synthase GlgA [Pseudomonas triclosanedens]MCP8471792.1 glycogen synthase GlgA [Pseudomonas triclosanedens]MCP8478487.1 glycogen synthase GlgA [Pseudomonas triclosanedens]WAI52316.1 glycogen synthase GlgA [Pseudomonas triclosanedens]